MVLNYTLIAMNGWILTFKLKQVTKNHYLFSFEIYPNVKILIKLRKDSHPKNLRTHL